jgi:3-hydroxyisobutyrate dehydrogenase
MCGSRHTASSRPLFIAPPLSPSRSGAREARLSIMVGGPEDVFRSCLPMLELMGRTVTRMGGAGCGQHTKMVNQILICTCMVGVCEALLYAQRAGLPLEPVIAAVSTGAAASWSLSNYGPRILAGNFEPGFYVEVSRVFLPAPSD